MNQSINLFAAFMVGAGLGFIAGYAARAFQKALELEDTGEIIMDGKVLQPIVEERRRQRVDWGNPK